MEAIQAVVYMLIGSACYKTLQYLKGKCKMGFSVLIPLVVSLLITANNFIMYRGSGEEMGAYVASFLVLALLIAVPVVAYAIYDKISGKSKLLPE